MLIFSTQGVLFFLPEQIVTFNKKKTAQNKHELFYGWGKH